MSIEKRVASKYLKKQSAKKEANFFRKIKRLFSKGVKQQEQELKKLGFKIIKKSEETTDFKNERRIGYGSVIEHTWDVETKGGFLAKITWTDILGKGMFFDGETTVRKDVWNGYYREEMWNEEYKARYKKNKGFFTWRISVYPKHRRVTIYSDQFVKNIDAYKMFQKLQKVKATPGSEKDFKGLRLASEKMGFNSSHRS